MLIRPAIFCGLSPGLWAEDVRSVCRNPSAVLVFATAIGPAFPPEVEINTRAVPGVVASAAPNPSNVVTVRASPSGA